MSQGHRRLGMLLLQSVLIQTTAFLIRPTSAYQAVELDMPTAALGAVGSSFAIVPLILAVPVGRWVDRLGARRLHVAGSTLVVFAAVALLLAPASAATLILANGLLGAGHLACIVAQQATVANSYTSSRLDSAFGYYTFAASLGQALGPTLIILFGGRGVTPETGPIYLAAFALSLGLLATTPSLPGIARGPATKSAEDASQQSVRDLLRVPGLTRAIATSAMVLAAIDLSVIYLPALGTELGLSSAFVGALLTVRALFSMLSRLVLGHASRLLGRTRLLTGSIVVSSLTMLLVPVPMPTWLLFPVVAVLGLGLGVGQPLTMSWVTQQAPAGRRGQALALRLAGNRTGQLVIPATLGLAASSTGASAAFLATALALGSTRALLRKVRLD